MSDLDAILAQIKSLSPEEYAKLDKETKSHSKWGKDALWIPNPGPQTDAYYSKADVLLYGGAGGGGKSLCIHTKIPTPHGWTTMGSIGVGDDVFDENGKVCKVIGVTDVMFGRPCYEMTFSDGTKVIADADHQWLTMTAKERDRNIQLSDEWREKRREKRPSRAKQNPTRPWSAYNINKFNKNKEHKYLSPTSGCVKTTSDISETLLHGNRCARNHSINVALPIECEDAVLPIDPYILGLWIGDGSSYKAEITTADDEILYAISACGYEISRRSKYTYGVNGGLLVKLRNLGILKNKRIPEIYLRSSFDQRLALLQGVMDTDGTCDTRGYCDFYSTKYEIAYAVNELINSLGIKSVVKSGWAKLNGRVVSEKFTINFCTSLPAFRLKRKLIRQKRHGFNGTNTRRYIVSVEKIKSVPVRCIEVNSDSKLYLVTNSFIPTHNSDLGIGLAFNEHSKSLLLRRRYSDISAMIERAIEINGTRTGFNGTPPPTLRTVNEKFIQFGANQHPGDEQSWKGRPYDFKFFDEVVDFLEIQVRFHLGWLRTTEQHQRCRAILGTNPPTSADGDWIVGMFRPWLDLTHPNPAKPTDLRWYVTDPDGNDIELDDSNIYYDDDGKVFTEIDGRKVLASSRTFIPAKLEDNPFLVRTNYRAQLDSLPEPVRSAVRDGNFMVGRSDAEWQVIPTQWIIEAQSRWNKDGWRDKGAMTAMAFDPAGGGKDAAELIMRYGTWFSEPITKKGEETADGSNAAATIIRYRRDKSPVIVDVGGGYGGAVTIRLKDNGVHPIAYNASSSSSVKTKDRHLTFANKRAEIWWRFREALDPDQEGGSAIALPPNTELRSDLASPTYEVTQRGIIVESKDKLRERLGRSPGKGDVVVMAWALGEAALKKSFSSSTGRIDPRGAGLPKFAKRRDGPLRRRRP